jgi:hypothetical protein
VQRILIGYKINSIIEILFLDHPVNNIAKIRIPPNRETIMTTIKCISPVDGSVYVERQTASPEEIQQTLSAAAAPSRNNRYQSHRSVADAETGPEAVNVAAWGGESGRGAVRGERSRMPEGWGCRISEIQVFGKRTFGTRSLNG